MTPITLDTLIDASLALRHTLGGETTLVVHVRTPEGGESVLPLRPQTALEAGEPGAALVPDVPRRVLPPVPPRQCNGCGRQTLDAGERWMPDTPDGYEPALCMRCAAMPDKGARR